VATCLGVFAAFCWTPDAWTAWEETIVEAILARYEDGAAFFVYWLLKIGSYPLMFFAVRLGLGIAFISLVMWLMTSLFGRKR
jgi:hypothetical protein